MKVNISIDDVSPHPLSSTSVVNQCQKIIDEFPEVKIMGEKCLQHIHVSDQLIICVCVARTFPSPPGFSSGTGTSVSVGGQVGTNDGTKHFIKEMLIILAGAVTKIKGYDKAD